METLNDMAAPDEGRLTARHAEIAATLTDSAGAAAWRAGFEAWDGLRREWTSWGNLTRLRYSQDTRRDEYREAQSELDRRTPGVTALDTAMKRRLLASSQRPALEDALGAHAFALWDADVTTFEPAIADDLIVESALAREYTELLARATVEFDGEERSLGGLGTYLQAARRETRHAAETARWSAFADRAEQLDALFDRLVRVRDGMARKLGFPSYTGLAYRRMHRIDYGASDVAAYRDEVARVVVPFAADLVRRLGRDAGYERTYSWDEAALGVGKDVRPGGGAAWILERTAEAFAALDPALGAFARIMVERNLLDVDSRPGKALGAYCTSFPTQRLPFVFANFNGSRSDVRTCLHEFGHAFQNYQSRDKAAVDYLTPTYESAEIHSMSLEYLAWPEMERFFGEDAAAYRREHLLDAMLFLPYGVAVDHFQHLVYAHPSANAAERNAMWQEMERTYLPWRDYGDLAHPARGGLWQEKRHIYVAPFYYIDYTLALCCALQLWVQAGDDRTGTLARYVALCGRGGEAPFRDLVRSAGLRSPFEQGALADVVTAASAAF